MLPSNSLYLTDSPPAFYTVAYCLLSVTFCLTSCLPVSLGNAARVVCCSLATSVPGLGSAHFGSTRHGMEKHCGRGVFSIARMRHNIYNEIIYSKLYVICVYFMSQSSYGSLMYLTNVTYLRNYTIRRIKINFNHCLNGETGNMINVGKY
jgi:hypothetical protein